MSPTGLGSQAQQVLFGEAAEGYDELTDDEGQPRAHWSELLSSLAPMGQHGLARLRARVARQVESDGITYNPVGASALATARGKPGAEELEPVHGGPAPWPLDPVPIVLSAQDWAVLEEGLAQRARLFVALLADLYGPQRMLEQGLLPAELVFAHRGYLRMAHESPSPSKPVFLHAVELGRKPSGEFVVHADRTQAPSGIGYAVAGRRVLMRTAPGVFQAVGPRSLGLFVQELRLALIETAPAGVEDPTVVVLSPGTGSETAFDQAHLALLMGFPLVQAPDLVVREGKLWMRSLGTLKRVDVVLRRVDSQYIDPLDLRPDSQLGVAGLVEAANRGTVTIVNSIGSGVLENPALAVFLPQLAQALLGEELLLDSATVLWGGRPADRAKIAEDLSELVVRDVVTGAARAGAGLTAKAKEAFARQLAAEPWRWVGQLPMRLSSAPVIAEPSGADEPALLEGAPVLLRCFTVAHGNQQVVLPGGLGQVMAKNPHAALPASNATKDIWVMQPATGAVRGKKPAERGARVVAIDVPSARVAEVRTDEAVTSPRVLADLFWIGRYGERAEALARLLIVIRERLQEHRSASGPDAPFAEPLESLFAAMEQVTAGPGFGSELSVARGLKELRAFTFDRERSGSLAQSADRLGNAAQGVRDQLSVDTWMVLADLERALERPVRQSASASWADELEQLSAAQSQVLAGMLALSGLASESMVHDPGWRLMDIGKRIERGLQLTALVRATLGKAHEAELERPLTEAVLSSVESAVIYRRRNHLRVRVGTVAELVFFDVDNPRSLVYQLEALRRNLMALPDAARSTRAEHALESLFSVLRRVEPDELERVSAEGERTELVQWLTAMHDGLRELASTIERSRLTPPSRMRPLWAGSGQAWS
ncbi:MAG: circularly permuted type 2 ATP-grasp protein [Segniliparus sp.]|uniref:circularly permuted type 2 ATP-grasp protein n=1 Tax=Segniliparus sp. TaxID=2804064 RepID=UPI003F2E74CE